MDINDRAGDQQAGLRTLPVVLGPDAALTVAVGCMLVGVAVAAGALASAAAVGAASGAGQLLTGSRYCAAAVLAASTIVDVVQYALQITRSRFDSHVVSVCVGKSFAPIGKGTILLGMFL
jgi:4-hydroxybenzoate polyprenyltransferase